MSGLFITLEGVDGAGKSSHTDWLLNFLQQYNKNVVLTREPGGTPLAEQLREMLLHQEMDQETETLLMFAARQNHIKQKILPALKAGNIVLSDRFTDATYAYQGGGRGFSLEKIELLEQWVQEGLQPDLTLLFDVSLEVARERLSLSREPDRFEKQSEAFFQSVRNAYLARAQAQPERFYLVDSSKSIEAIRQDLEQFLTQRLASLK